MKIAALSALQNRENTYIVKGKDGINRGGLYKMRVYRYRSDAKYSKSSGEERLRNPGSLRKR